MNPFSAPAVQDAPPPYEEHTSSDPAPTSPSSLSTSPPLSPLEIRQSIGSSIYEPPPEFSVFPVTFEIRPDSTLITPAVGSRGVYELTQPLDGRAPSVFLAEIPPDAALDEDGHLLEMREQYQLYKVYEAAQLPHDPDATAISAQKRGLVPGTVLQRRAKGYIWEATSHGEKWIAKGKVIYSARRCKNGDLPWKDSDDRLVAIEHVAEHPTVDPETLEILVPLSKKMLDFLVAVWVAKVFQEAAKERVSCEEAEKKRRREERKAKEQEEGRQVGLLRDVRGKFRLKSDGQAIPSSIGQSD